MTHFTTLVAVPEHKSLEDILLPYHEYESTGIERFVEFVPYSDEEVDESFKKYGEDSASLEDFMENYWGAKNVNGVWGRYTNPNSHWDWFVIGGRWHGYMGDKDYGTKGELALEETRLRNLASNLKTYDTFWKARQDFYPVAEDVEKAVKLLENNSYAKRFWTDAKELATDIGASNAMGREYLLLGLDDIHDFKRDRDDFINLKAWKAPVHSFVDLDGVWHERGSMGWWAMCDDENANTFDGETGEFWTFIRDLPEDVTLVLVDCHI